MNEGKTRYFAGGLYWGYCDPSRPKIRFNSKVKNFSNIFYFFIITILLLLYNILLYNIIIYCYICKL